MPESPSPPGPPDDPLAPYDLSSLCDGKRTDFPLGMLVESVNVMLNDVYLLEGLDFLLAHKHGQSKVETRQPPRAGDRLVVLRVPARPSVAARPERSERGHDDVPPYSELPKRVKDNIAAEQWPAVLTLVVRPGSIIPESAQYVNLKNGMVFQYQLGQRANGPLLAVHDLAGGRGKEDRQVNHLHTPSHPHDRNVPPRPTA